MPTKLYDQIYNEIKQEFIEGTVDIDEIQNRILRVVAKASPVSIGVSALVVNTLGEEITYSVGSGVIIEQEELENSDKQYRYYFFTNHHVISGGTRYRATFIDDTYIPANLVGSDETTDIALLYFDSNRLYAVAELGDSDKAKIGEIVLSVGNPKGESLFGSVTMGIIGGKDRHLIENGIINTLVSYIQHDAAINSGNSGGGLFDLDGKVVGINTAKYTSSEIEGLNFAIPINSAKEVIYEIRNFGHYSGKVSFGISVTSVKDLTQAGKETYFVPKELTEGVLVRDVQSTGSAYNILKVNDVIVEADGKKISTSEDLSRAIMNYRIGDTIHLVVIRPILDQESGTTTSEFVELDITFIRNR